MFIPLMPAGLLREFIVGLSIIANRHRPRDALLLVREDGAFLLVGQLKSCPMAGRAVAYQFFDAAGGAAEEAADPLDFSMM